MSVESHLFEKKEKNWISRLLKLTFFLCAFALVGITILANMGGSTDELKQSIERFMSDLFKGRPVQVEQLVSMTFFPRIGFDAEGINVMSKPEDGYSILRLGKVRVFMGFWNVATRTPKFTHFYIENVEAIKGALGPREFYVDKIFIDHDTEKGVAQLRGDGKIGVYPWSFEMNVDVFGSKGKYSYMLSKNFPLVFDVANIHFETRFINHEDNYYKLQDFKISSDGVSISGNLILSALSEKLLKLKGDISIGENKTDFSPDLVFDYTKYPAKVSGTVIANQINYKDFASDRSVLTLLRRLHEIAGYNEIKASDKNNYFFLNGYALDIDFDFKKLSLKSSDLADIKFPLQRRKNALKFGPVSHNTTQVMPSLMLLTIGEDEQTAAILQKGVLNIEMFKDAFGNIPSNLLSKEVLGVECGMAMLETRDDHRLSLLSFAIGLSDGSIGSKVETLNRFDPISDLKLSYSTEPAELKTISLDNQSYDYVNSVLKSASESSPCAAYVIKQNVQVDQGKALE